MAQSDTDAWVRSWLTPWADSEKDPQRQIGHVRALWHGAVPADCARGTKDLRPRLLRGARYTRGDHEHPRRGEHEIEHQILCRQFANLTVEGCPVADGVNAFLLTRDTRGGRRTNVEADLLLLIHTSNSYTLLLAEVKDAANDVWYAPLENLRQLRLLQESHAAHERFRRRQPSIARPDGAPLAGALIAPASFYIAGQRRAPMLAAVRLLLHEIPVSLRLLTWTTSTAALTPFNADA